MKLKIKKIFPWLMILFICYISNMFEFNYMNYNFFINKYLFIFIFNIFILISSINKINIDLDNKYLFNLHILLNIIWLFLFFFYKNTIYSLISISFNIIILILYLKKNYKNNILFNSFYFIWYCYLLSVNLLIL